MIFRVIIVILCLTVFINGCNSLISLQFGTHKLRTISIDQVIENGVGDADYLEITGAWQTDDYIYVPGKKPPETAVIIYPLLSEDQVQKVESGQQIAPAVIAWTKQFDRDG